MMDWLTKEQVQSAANKSRKAAIVCSQEHWRQLSMATRKGINEAPEKLWFLIRGGYCSLCPRCANLPNKCEGCPLHKLEGGFCCDEWQSVREVVDQFTSYGWDRASWRRWKRAARRMYQVVIDCK